MKQDDAPSDLAPEATEHFEEGEEAPPPGVRIMAIVRWLLVALMAGAALASFLYVFGDSGEAQGDPNAPVYYCPMHPSVVQDHPGECPICSMSLVLKEQSKSSAQPKAPASDAKAPTGGHAGHRHEASDVYYCPMHPEETSPGPDGRCPICGMKLEKKPGATSASTPERGRKAAEGQHRPIPGPAKDEMRGMTDASGSAGAPPADVVGVDLSTERIQLIGMRTARVVHAPLTSELRTVGYVVPTESGFATVQTRFSGWIQELHVRETGQPVKRGQLLARVYSPELLAAQQELLNAKRWTTGPTAEASRTAGAPSSLLASAQSRLALLGMDAQEIAEVERSGEAHRLVEIRSPVKGYISQKNALEGLYIQPGTQLFEIADLSKVWVIAEIFERDAGRVRMGQLAKLELAAYPGESFSGRVQFLYPSLDANTRTLRARIEFKNAALRLRPGMYGDVRLEAPPGTGLMIPREAVVDTGVHQYVFVAQEGGHFEPRAIRLGARSDDAVQVVAGLSMGETVVTTGNFLIDSESRLRSAIEGTASAAASQSSACDGLFDRQRYPDKYQQCRSCEAQHRGMGTMEDDCRKAIPKPWR
jgi:Cu(I)/Ag(I) efflux system membrane fusion protein